MGKIDPVISDPVGARRALPVPAALPLQDALNTDEALALRKAYRCGERPECARCVCPLYKGARALMKI